MAEFFTISPIFSGALVTTSIRCIRRFMKAMQLSYPGLEIWRPRYTAAARIRIMNPLKVFINKTTQFSIFVFKMYSSLYGIEVEVH